MLLQLANGQHIETLKVTSIEAWDRGTRDSTKSKRLLDKPEVRVWQGAGTNRHFPMKCPFDTMKEAEEYRDQLASIVKSEQLGCPYTTTFFARTN